MPMTTSASALPGSMSAQSRGEGRLRGKRLRVEVLLAGTTVPEPLPVHDLVEADLWSQLPADLPALLTLLPRADLYLQDEMQVAFHPTLTRVWCRKGRRGQRLVEAPGDNRKVYGFGLLDWRDGWFDGRVAPGRTADVFCEQVRAAVARSKQRGRVAIVIADNLKTHTSAGSLLVRGLLTELQEHLSICPGQGSRCSSVTRSGRIIILEAYRSCRAAPQLQLSSMGERLALQLFLRSLQAYAEGAVLVEQVFRRRRRSTRSAIELARNLQHLLADRAT